MRSRVGLFCFGGFWFVCCWGDKFYFKNMCVCKKKSILYLENKLIVSEFCYFDFNLFRLLVIFVILILIFNNLSLFVGKF